MFLNHTFGYPESLDYAILPGFERLSEENQRRVHAAFEMGYNSAKHMGVKTAMGTGHETAKLELEELLKPVPAVEQSVPPSIFAGLDNC
jgi:hypothetical protein